MNQNSNNSRNTILTIYLILILLTPPVTALFTLLIQYIKQNNRIKNGMNTRILSLDDISSPMQTGELLKFIKPGGFISIPNFLGYERYIRIDFEKYYNLNCTKEYFFKNDMLYMCNYQMDKSGNGTEAKFIFRKLVKTYGYPDKVSYDKYNERLKCFWYGVNGNICFTRFISNMVDITFELN